MNTENKPRTQIPAIETEIVDEPLQGDVAIIPGPMTLTPPTQMVSQADRLVEMAIASGADIERLDKLLDLKERYEKEEARKAFTAALAAFKGEDVTITKDKDVGFQGKDGWIGYSHATLGNVVGTAVPLMSKHGLSHRWDIIQDSGKITVTCILTHEGGHSENVQLTAAPDDTGKKNSIQQVASTITYLERYTFLSITGLAVEDQMDDDGVKAAVVVEYISEDQVNVLHAMVNDNGLELSILLNWIFKALGANCLENIPEDKFGFVKNKIQAGIEAKKPKA